MRCIKIFIPLISALALFYSSAVCQESKTNLRSASRNPFIVNSIPDGADVYLDQEYAGKTPVEINYFPSEPYLIKIKKEGFKDWNYSFFYRGDRRRDIVAVLDGTYGLLSIQSDPGKASVFLDDSLVGITPIHEMKLATGSHNLKLKKQGYQDWMLTFRMPPALETIEHRLTRLNSEVSFINVPSTASVRIDGLEQDSITRRSQLLFIGSHEFEITDNTLMKNIREDIEIDPDYSYQITTRFNDFTLTPFGLSLLVPGSGQFYNKSYLKGFAIFTGALASGYLLNSALSNYDKKLQDYNYAQLEYSKSQNENAAIINRRILLNTQSEAKSALNLKKMAIGAFIGIYVYNLLDALIFESRTDYLNVYKTKIALISGTTLPKTDQDVQFSFGIPLN